MTKELFFEVNKEIFYLKIEKKEIIIPKGFTYYTVTVIGSKGVVLQKNFSIETSVSDILAECKTECELAA